MSEVKAFLNSDNIAGIMPEVIAAVQAASTGSVPAYGADPVTARVERLFSAVFERECTVYLVATGTAANSLAFAACCRPYSAIFCHAGSHVHIDEAALGGDDEFGTGCGDERKEGPDADADGGALRALGEHDIDAEGTELKQL